MHFFKTSYDKDYFNSVYSLVQKHLFLKTEVSNKTSLILKNKHKGKLLEIGCGEGQLLYSLQKYFTVQGMDISKDSVEKTNKLFGRKVALYMDIENTALREKYDVIIAFDVLEHLHNPEKVIGKLTANLTDNGIFIFAVPNNYGFVGTIATKIFNFVDKTHISVLKRSEWIEIIIQTGLSYQIWDQIGYTFAHSKWAKYISSNLVVIAHR
jgi:2-polyprenyl-3-methyl-5-hydroxy-6-metoxy-1,4-benzoquinol methylase